MADRIPLIVDSSTQQIKELPAGDSLILSDNEKVILGTGSDLEVYHTGTDSIIQNNEGVLDIVTTGTGNAGGRVQISKNGLELIARFVPDGEVSLYYNNSEKIVTTSTGATVTGLLTATTSANITQVALTSTSNAVAWDAQAAANAYHLLTENTTFAAPSNAVEGAIISVEIAQGATPYTVAWNTVFEFAASTAPTMTATANKTDIFSFRYNGSVWQEIGRVQNMAQT